MTIYPEPDPLITPAEAARRLSVAKITLIRWRREGKHLAPVLIGSRWRYRLSDINRFIAAGTRPRTLGTQSFDLTRWIAEAAV